MNEMLEYVFGTLKKSEKVMVNLKREVYGLRKANKGLSGCIIALCVIGVFNEITDANHKIRIDKEIQSLKKELDELKTIDK